MKDNVFKEDEWFEDAELELLKLIANIMQTSHKDSSRLASAVIAQTSGAAGVGGVLGLIGMFGSASTGTAIASLSGAASTTATFYWVGSLVGGGVFAGTILTGGVGLLAAYCGAKWWKGTPRDPEELTEEESIIIDASLGLVKVLREQIKLTTAVSKKEINVLYEKAWAPLVLKVSQYNDGDANDNLNFKNLLGVDFRVKEMDELSTRLTGYKYE